MYVYIYLYPTRVCVCMYVYIHTYTHTHTYIQFIHVLSAKTFTLFGPISSSGPGWDVLGGLLLLPLCHRHHHRLHPLRGRLVQVDYFWSLTSKYQRHSRVICSFRGRKRTTKVSLKSSTQFLLKVGREAELLEQQERREVEVWQHRFKAFWFLATCFFYTIVSHQWLSFDAFFCRFWKDNWKGRGRLSRKGSLSTFHFG